MLIWFEEDQTRYIEGHGELRLLKGRRQVSAPPGTGSPSEASPCSDCASHWSEELDCRSGSEHMGKKLISR
jgi:hypothetical protein